jgi:GT2 family glycosyltransferase
MARIERRRNTRLVKYAGSVKNRNRSVKFKVPGVSRSYPAGPAEAKEYAVPDWFHSTQNVDVSIVVPLYQSQNEIRQQIESWDLSNDNLTKEIIYVDDKCPQKSKDQVIVSWTKRNLEISAPVGKIITHSINSGFGTTCNTGARYASGEYLVFLNADCIITNTGWVKPMIDLLRSDPQIGMVGNLQTKNGYVDSAGSEWVWGDLSFQHIGRSIYNGKCCSKIKIEEMPEDLLVAKEREMVTGCCFAIPKKLFMDLEGFDPVYRIAYWEDSDLCMRLRSNGYKIYYQPLSIIEHKVGHSHAHQYASENRKEFITRWVYSGRLDALVKSKRNIRVQPVKAKKTKTYGCVIVCNEEEFIKASVDSVAPIIDEWCFVVGGNEYAVKAGMCDKSGYPTDNTLQIVKELAKTYGGKVIEPPGRCWKNKIEMRASYAQFLNPGDLVFVLDGDEVYKPDKLERIKQLMMRYGVLHLQYWSFWNNINTIGTGAWRGYPQERVIRWQSGFGYYTNHLFAQNKNKSFAYSNQLWSGQENMFYHYSWVRPIEKIRQKILYYKHQTGGVDTNYVDEIFLKWRETTNDIPYTHPRGSGGWAPFVGIHPDSIQKLINEGKLSF